jgi:hypothetical protein
MGTPNYPRDMANEWSNVKKDIRSLFTSASYRRALQQMGATGLKVFKFLEMQAGSYIKFKYPGGNDGLFLGRFGYGGDDVDGIAFFRPAGNFSFLSFSKVSDASGFTAIWDQSGNIILSDDGSTKKGLANPWLEHTVVDTNDIAGPPASHQTTSTSDTAIQSAFVPIQHSNMRIWYYAVPVSGSPIEVKLKNLTTGATVYSATHTTSGYVDSGTFPVGDYNFHDIQQFDFTIRRTAGTGTVGATLIGFWGVQS